MLTPFMSSAIGSRATSLASIALCSAVLLAAINSKVGQEPIKILEFVGQNANIAEPEKDRFYVLARPQCYVIVECVSPAGKFKDEEILFRLFMKSFEFKGCPSW